MVDLRAGVRWCVDRSLPAAVAASALAVTVLIAGPIVLGLRPTHRFLLWNLFLAWIPFGLALVLDVLDQGRRRRGASLVVGGSWLLFLPNAPYLVSDLVHLKTTSPTPWLDLARLVSFAWAGCLLAVLSLRVVHGVVARRAGRPAAWVVVVLSAVASGFGVVLGRFSRLNSWHALTAPDVVVAEVRTVVESGRLVAVAGFFALLLLTIYAALHPSRA